MRMIAQTFKGLSFVQNLTTEQKQMSAQAKSKELLSILANKMGIYQPFLPKKRIHIFIQSLSNFYTGHFEPILKTRENPTYNLIDFKSAEIKVRRL